jgi:hypothetical protein
LIIGTDKWGRKYCYDEMYVTDVDLETLRPQIASKFQKYGVRFAYCDPSRPESITMMNKTAPRMWECVKGANDIVNGIMAVGQYFKIGTDGKPRMLIHPRCKNLIAVVQMYRYSSKRKEGKGSEMPMGKNDHLCFAAGTMIETERGSIPIEKVIIGDKILTRNGYKSVLDSGMTCEDALVYDYPIGLTATPNHPVYDCNTNLFIPINQYCNAKHPLTLSDIGDLECMKMKQSSIKDTNTEDTPKWKGLMGDISKESQLKTTPNTFTEESGKISTDQSPKDLTSTTSTKTRIIMTHPISNAYYDTPTKVFTPLNIIKKTEPPFLNIWKESDHSLKNGMEVKKDLNGIPNMEKMYGEKRTESLTEDFVNGAEEYISLPIQQFPDSVGETVDLRGVGRMDGIISPFPVCTAVYLSPRINIPKRNVVPKNVVGNTGRNPRYAPVYNLTVEDSHEYFANGILVHNCDCMKYSISTPMLEKVRNSSRFNMVTSSRKW